MWRVLPVFAFLLQAVAAASSSSLLHASLSTTFPLKNAAFSIVADNFGDGVSPALVVSTFAAFGKTPVNYVPHLDKVTTSAQPAVVRTVDETLVWTNYLGTAPPALGASVLATAGGFLVPGKGTGTIDLFDMTHPAAPVRQQISTDKKGWFYHKLVWHDMNGDGLLDVVAARATAPSNPAGELIWLEQPSGWVANQTGGGAWKETVVVAGPDVDFIMEDLDGDGKAEVIAAQFFSASQLAVYACEAPTWSECNTSNVKVTVIDDKSGPFFTVKSADLNHDGRMDLLVSNNEDGKNGPTVVGSVFAYEQPSSQGGTWARHTLATGFTPYPSLLPSPGAHSKGSPGTSEPFHIDRARAGQEKPEILLSGDDGGFVALLRAHSEVATDWGYSVEYLVNSTGTIGGPAIQDINGDGLAEIFIPFYSEGKIEVYNFTTAPPPGPSPAVQQTCRACLAKKDPVHLFPAYAWCYKDSQCHVVGSLQDPCHKQDCTSAAGTSHCACTSCNDAACHA